MGATKRQNRTLNGMKCQFLMGEDRSNTGSNKHFYWEILGICYNWRLACRLGVPSFCLGLCGSRSLTECGVFCVHGGPSWWFPCVFVYLHALVFGSCCLLFSSPHPPHWRLSGIHIVVNIVCCTTSHLCARRVPNACQPPCRGRSTLDVPRGGDKQ